MGYDCHTMLMEMRAIAKQKGAFGLVISGAGPTLCAICDNEHTAATVSEAMKAAYAASAIESTARVTQVSAQGAYARVVKD